MLIRHKIWLASGMLLVGYLFSVAFGFVQNGRTENSLRRTVSTRFPAAQLAQSILTAFEEQTRLFEQGVIFGDEEMLAEAKTKGEEVIGHLTALRGLEDMERELAEGFEELERETASYNRRADDLYAKMASGDLDAVSAAARADVANEREQLHAHHVEHLEETATDLRDTLLRAQTNSARARVASIVVFFVVAGLSALALRFVSSRMITGPLNDILARVRAIADGDGDLTQRIEVHTTDEIGELAEAFNRFVSKIQDAIRDVAANADVVGSSSRSLHQVSKDMRVTANETMERSQVAARESDEVNSAALSAASSAEEMSASINEIAQNAARAAQETGHAVENVQQATLRIAELDEASTEIGSVIKVIESIAEQTNLLALNATIEAARAGDAGKGFAVVANEVKELASQTAKATETSAQKIRTIQESTQRSVMAMDEIGAVIRRINDISTTIAAAVEQQSAATQEISQSVNSAARGSSSITQNVSLVAQSAQDASARADSTSASANELSSMVDQLQRLVGQFRY